MTVPTVTCPKCGRDGTFSGKLMRIGSGKVFDRLTGLDMRGCDGCREVADSLGVVAIRERPGPLPGTATVQLDNLES